MHIEESLSLEIRRRIEPAIEVFVRSIVEATMAAISPAPSPVIAQGSGAQRLVDETEPRSTRRSGHLTDFMIKTGRARSTTVAPAPGSGGGAGTTAGAVAPSSISPTPAVLRRRMRCKKCGAEGFRSDGCGKTHNTQASKPAAPGDDDDSEPEGLAMDMDNGLDLSIARHEPSPPSVIVDNVPELEAELDVESDEIDGGGSFPIRADYVAPPRGELSPTDRREMCRNPDHGWVGRQRFQLERHDLCEAPLEPIYVDVSDEDDDERGPGPVVLVDNIEDAGGVRRQKRRRNPELSRPKTLSRRLIRAMLLLEDNEEAVDPHRDRILAEARPRSRAECADGPRPCPWASCRHHLYLEVNPLTGSIKFNFPNHEIEDLAETCVLDVADRGAITLEETGEYINVTRERARQLEVRGTTQLRAALPHWKSGDV